MGYSMGPEEDRNAVKHENGGESLESEVPDEFGMKRGVRRDKDYYDFQLADTRYDRPLQTDSHLIIPTKYFVPFHCPPTNQNLPNPPTAQLTQ